MTTEQGIVVNTNGARARIKTQKTSACGDCSAKGYCHTLGGGKEVEVDVLNAAGAKQGDRVLVGFETGSLIKASFLLYIVPVLGMLAGAILGERLSHVVGMGMSAASVLFSFSLFAVTFLFVRKKGNDLAKKASYQPKIIRVIEKADQVRAIPDSECQVPN